MMNRKTIHSRCLRAYRKKHKCTISEMAKTTNIHFDLLTKWSMGVSLIPPVIMPRFLVSIDMTKTEFLKLGETTEDQIESIRAWMG